MYRCFIMDCVICREVPSPKQGLRARYGTRMHTLRGLHSANCLADALGQSHPEWQSAFVTKSKNCLFEWKGTPQRVINASRSKYSRGGILNQLRLCARAFPTFL